MAYIERGDLLRARQFSGELLAAADRLGTPRAIVAACWNAAILAEQTRRGDEALALAERALAIHSENGDARNLARVRGAYAGLLLRVRPEEAETARDLLLRVRRELTESSASRNDRALCDVELARAELILGDNAKAAEYAKAALDTLTQSARGIRAEARLMLGHAYMGLGRAAEAAAELAAAAEWLDKAPVSRSNTQSWVVAAARAGAPRRMWRGAPPPTSAPSPAPGCDAGPRRGGDRDGPRPAVVSWRRTRAAPPALEGLGGSPVGWGPHPAWVALRRYEDLLPCGRVSRLPWRRSSACCSPPRSASSRPPPRSPTPRSSAATRRRTPRSRAWSGWSWSSTSRCGCPR